MTEASKNSTFRWVSFSLKSLLVLVTVAAILIGYLQRQYERSTINDWIDLELANLEASSPAVKRFTPVPDIVCPKEISSKEQLRLLMKATRWVRDPQRRQVVLKIIVEQFPKEAHACCRKIASESKDAELRRNSLRIIGLYKDKDDVEFLSRFLDHEDRSSCAAAIDAIGIIHGHSFPLPVGSDLFFPKQIYPKQIYLKGEIPISLVQLRGFLEVGASNKNSDKTIDPWPATEIEVEPLPKNLRERFETLLLHRTDQNVREAAARTLQSRPKDDYQLRIAEWGVWINQGASLTLAKSVIDEIPPFVHQSGNSIEAIEEGRLDGSFIITKPIVHITTNAPMVVNIAVKISKGRPWFGYPLPDDFCVAGTPYVIRKNTPDVPEDLKLRELKGMRSGYPWLAPEHYNHAGSQLADVGFRWQSLLVLPEKADWMEAETVGDDPKYQWWNRLREVPTNWVCNRGESERFLYYDGPTDRPSPVFVVADGRELGIQAPDQIYPEKGLKLDLIFIEVNEEGVSAVDKVMNVSNSHPQPQPTLIFDTSDRPWSGDQVRNRLLELIVERGLTREEAEGMIDCWSPQFFETGGRRLLTIFGKEEYDSFCPLSVSPNPTEVARVGIVLTELRKNE